MKFTKENTLQLKGIAVIFLLYHHLFNSPSMYQNFEVSFFPLTERIVNLLSWFGKNCVSFFAFLSAYGLAVSYMKLSEKKGAADGWIKRRLLKLYKGYWFVFVGAFFICSIIDRMPIKVYMKSHGIANIILDMLGLSAFLGTPSMNGAWWYMSLAVTIIIIVPVVDCLCKKIGGIATIVLTFIMPRIFGIGFQGNNSCLSFLFIVICGVIFAENDIFTKIAKWVQKRALYYKWLIFIMFLVGLYVTFKLYITCDVTVCTELNYGIVPLLWIVFAYLYVSKIPIVNTILEFIGKHSMNIFYVHIFFRNNYCYNFIYSFKNSFLIVTILFLLSLVTSYGIEWAKKAVKYDYVWEKFENKVLNIN